MSDDSSKDPQKPQLDIFDDAGKEVQHTVHGVGKDGIQKAVAIGYDREEDNAPKVLASGKGAVAEQIMSLAFAHGVKVRKDADLVEVLSKIEVEETIPLEAFTAVAEILSYVYNANAIYGKNASKLRK